MSLFIDSSLRASLREVMAWEKKNPDITARDAAAFARRGEKMKADLIKTVTTPIARTPRSKRKFAPHSAPCPHCKTSFWMAHHSQKYCTENCKVAAAKAKTTERKS